ncbi:MAG: hypothetical protein A3F83_00720 [Candidatus Glassbacteria bacterium RIFCSPLOWO2_12_FULL_58_11]|uniref:DUF503 domain-containing protein n=2 Tax=Candidatus Glassiibacteriota TaxID=1817805 RepID=A0A1F5YPS0_9BACT|nr:MAG: hypothetical protein A2Z86_03455 [Candidatus Glassbacteria bacterium GWA2_58_10]OGG02189.1 MAG: hypothetical protein A3F83_00720 [Candidatus Glassbacteria bacterium RIFCSPLOWO2_12_FULL_58_11]
MVIGVCTFDLYLAGIHSLKAKRGVLKRLKARIISKFNVSVAEVGAQDSWQRSRLAVAVVSNEQRFANQVLSKVSELVVSNGEVALIDQEMTFF